MFASFRFDIEDAFSKIGRVRDVWVARKVGGRRRSHHQDDITVLSPQPPGFAFIEMEDRRDAEDAVKDLDGTRMCGNRVKVIGRVVLVSYIRKRKNSPAAAATAPAPVSRSGYPPPGF